MSNQYLMTPSELAAAERAIKDVVGELDVIENRRFALEKAIHFYKDGAVGVINAEATVHVADLFFDYVHHGRVPNATESRAAIAEYAETVIRHTFPMTSQRGTQK